MPKHQNKDNGNTVMPSKVKLYMHPKFVNYGTTVDEKICKEIGPREYELIPFTWAGKIIIDGMKYDFYDFLDEEHSVDPIPNYQ